MKYTRDEIIQRAEDIAKMLSETEEVAFYKQAEQKIHENEKVILAVDKIKKLQKEAINLKHYEKTAALKQVEQEIAELEEQLAHLPIVEQFKQSQEEVNDLLQLITSAISEEVTEAIDAATIKNKENTNNQKK